MKPLTTIIGFALLALLGAAAVLGLAWLISLAIRGLWDVGLYPSLVLALGVLGILVLFVGAVALKETAELPARLHEVFGTDEADEEGEEDEEREEEEGAWFSPCP